MPSILGQTQNLQALGAVLPVKVGVPKVLRDVLAKKNETPRPPMTVQALIDTGASRTCISPDICQKLNLKPHGVGKMLTVGEPTFADVYNIYMDIEMGPGNFVVLDPIMVFAPSLAGAGNFQCLIGRDILAGASFTYLGYVNMFSFSV